MGRVVKLIGLAWCFGLLVLPGTLFLLGKRSSNVENRTLVAYPQRTLANIFKIATYRQSSDALVDRLPIRDRAISLKARTLLAIGDNPNPLSLVVGKDGWLFITDEVLCDAEGTTTAAFFQQLALARSAAEAAGKRFATVIVPTKMVQEDRHFGVHHSWEQCARDRQAELRREAVGKPGIIDLWTPLDAISASGRDVFWRTDSHMGPLGKLAYARTVEQAVEPVRARTIRITLGKPFEHLGDNTLLTGYKQFEIDRPIVTHTTTATPPAAGAPIVMLGDSQTEEIQDQFSAGILSSFGFCHWDKGFWVGTCDPQLRDAGTIVIETVGRAIWRRTEPGFGTRLFSVLLPVIPSTSTPWIDATGTKPGPGGSVTLTNARATLHVQLPADSVRRRRVIRFTLDATAVGGEPFIQLLIDGKPGTEVLTSIPSAPSGVELTLVVPPGVALSRTAVAVGSSPGATVSAARISVLG